MLKKYLFLENKKTCHLIVPLSLILIVGQHFYAEKMMQKRLFVNEAIFISISLLILHSMNQGLQN